MRHEFVFNIGEDVIYQHGGERKHCTVIGRKAYKDHFLSEIHNGSILLNLYITQETATLLKGRVSKFKWEDKELTLRSANFYDIPEGAVEYASDEYTADYLDASGNIIQTIKAGVRGVAHQFVSTQFH